MYTGKLAAVAVVLSLALMVSNSSAQPRPEPEQAGSLPGSTFGLVMREYDEWAAVQKTYPPEQVKEMRAKFIQKASQLSGPELEDLLGGIHERLQILLSAEANDARRWLTQSLATAADAKAAKIKAKLPDVAKLSAEELEEQLDKFSRDRAAQRSSYSAFSKERSSQIERAEADARRQAEASARSASSAAGYSGYVPSSAPKDHKRTPLPSYISGPRYYGGYAW